MFVDTRKPTGKSQETVASECGIDRKRYIKIEKLETLPDPHELVQIDKALGQSGVLILKYCSGVCPAGKEIGFCFEETSAAVAGMKVFKSLREADETVRPELEDILADGKIGPDERSRFNKICGLLSGLQQSIMSLLAHKEKAACLAEQTAFKR